jgi:hypothetical protein
MALESLGIRPLPFKVFVLSGKVGIFFIFFFQIRRFRLIRFVVIVEARITDLKMDIIR